MNRAERLTDAKPRWQVRVVGSFAILDCAGHDVTPRGRKACAILAYLATREGDRVPRERLAALLWGDRGPAQARASLRQSLLEIRHALGDPSGPVEADRGHVWMGEQAVDLVGLEGTDGTVQLFEDLDHISGEFDEWLAIEREHLLRRFVDRECRQLERQLETGHAPACLARIERLEAIDPANEEVLRLRMRAEAEAGRAAGVKQAYLAYADYVGRELGVTPADESRALRDELLAALTRGADPAVPPLADPGPLPDRAFFAALSPASPATGNDAALYLEALDPLPEPAPATPPQPPAAPAPASDPPTSSQPPPPRAVRAVPRWAWWAAGVAALAGLGGLAAVLPIDKASGNELVVMPLAGEGVDPRLAAGFAQDLGRALAADRSIRVMGRTAQLVGADGAPQVEAMRDRLGIDYVLTGTLARRGDGLELALRLVRTRDSALVWQGLEQAPSLSPALEGRIVRAVSGALGSRAFEAAEGRAPAIAAADYDAYLQSLAMIRAREGVGVRAARDLLYRLVERNPDFAPAWAQIGVAELLASADRPDAIVRARTALERALALDPALAEAHAGLGLAAGQGNPAGRRALARAVQLDPRDPQILYWFASAELSAGQGDRADRALDLALRFDPYWRRPIEVRAQRLAGQGRLDEALALADRLAADQPAAARGARIMALAAAGAFADAVQMGAADLSETMASHTGMMALDEALVALGLPTTMTYGAKDPALADLALGRLPPQSALRASVAAINRSTDEMGGRDFLLRAAPALLAAGRAEDLIDLLTRLRAPGGGQPVLAFDNSTQLMEHGPHAAAALAAAGRMAESNALTARLRALFAIVDRQRPDQQMLVQSAAVALLAGDRAGAVERLSRAERMGFVAITGTPASSLSANPLFQGLKGDPAFTAIAARNQRRWQAQRAEAMAARPVRA